MIKGSPSFLPPTTTARQALDRPGMFLRLAQPLLLPLTVAFTLLTVVNFLGPVVILGAPESLRQPFLAVWNVLLVALVAVQLAVLAVATPFLTHSPAAASSRRLRPMLSAAIVIAIINATRLALGIRGTGLGSELIAIVLFVAPLVLLYLAVQQLLARDAKPWWVGPMQLVLVAFPLVFLMASLSRVDFRSYTGTSVPPPVAWFLAYGPTLIVATLALTSWIAMETFHASRRIFVVDACVVLAASVLIAVSASLNSSVGFVLSAMVTWGSGYQLFAAPSPFPTLFLSFLLLSAAFVSLSLLLIRLRQRGVSVKAPVLAFMAVLSGVFGSAVSILGCLAALVLLLVEITGAVQDRQTLQS